MITTIRRVIGGISLVLGYVAAIIIFPLILASVYEVASRYIFNQPTIWAYEIGYMAMGASFLLAAAYTLRDGQHVRIDIVAMNLPLKVRAALDLICYLVLFLPIATWLSWALAVHTFEAWEWGERTGQSAWNPPVWPYYSVFAIAFVTLTLQAIAEALGNVQVLMNQEREV